MLREHFTFAHPLRVRWAEVDRQDVVFNGNYFLYFDVAVAEYWRAIGFEYPRSIVALGMDIFCIKATAEYHAPAHYDDVLEVGCRAARVGRSSLVLLFGIWRGTERLTSGELIYVNADLATRKSAPWPGFVREKILAFERTQPEVVG